MPFARWPLLKSLFSSRRRPSVSKRILPKRRMALEHLEQRTLLAIVTWDGGGGDFNWNNALNWSGDTLPGAGDDVTIGEAFSAITVVHNSGSTSINHITSHATLSITDGSQLSLDAPSTLHGISFIGGARLARAADVTITDSATINNGWLEVSGTTTVRAFAGRAVRGDSHVDQRLAIRGPGEWRPVELDEHEDY
jgi:hypothetical protein